MNLNDQKRKELMQHVEEILVPHTAFNDALDQLEQGMRVASIIRDPLGYFISGESRTGKSRVIEEFKGRHPSTRLLEGMVVPVLYVEVPSKPTVKGLVSEILAALGDPLAEKGTEQERTRRLLKLLDACRTKVLILDEFQHFVDKSAKFAVMHHISDWLKNLLNKAKIVTVIAGLPYANTVLAQNEQLRGRFTHTLNLPRFSWKDADSNGEFLGLLDGFTDYMQEHFSVVNFAGEDLAYRFYLATGGLTGYVFNIIRKAAWNVLDEGRCDINMADLHKAYSQVVHKTDQQASNPFSLHFNLGDGAALELASNIGRRADDYALGKLPGYKPSSIHAAIVRG